MAPAASATVAGLVRRAISMRGTWCSRSSSAGVRARACSGRSTPAVQPRCRSFKRTWRSGRCASAPGLTSASTRSSSPASPSARAPSPARPRAFSTCVMKRLLNTGTTVAIPYADLQAQYRALQGEIDAAIHDVVASAQYVLGPAVGSFEKAFAEYCDVGHTVAVNSGTSALHLALLAAGI